MKVKKLAQTLEGKLAFCWAVVEGLVLKLEQQRLDLKPPEIGMVVVVLG